MDETTATRAPQPQYEGQIRRAQRGVVAAYIHEVSERHAENGPAAAEPSGDGED